VACVGGFDVRPPRNGRKTGGYATPPRRKDVPHRRRQLDPQLQLVFPLLSAASCLEDA
jgi:hypothetical protein